MNRHGVFISYSKKDAKWLDYLRTHLSYLEREYKFTIWEDSKIEVGTEWRAEINKAISSTKIAILMVSANFISSEFINNEELPALLAAAKEEGAYIFPIIISHCMFSDIEAISKFQTINPPSEPLTLMNEGQRDALFLKVTREIKRVLSTNVIEQRINKAPAPTSVSLEELRLSFVRATILSIFFMYDVPHGLSIKKVYVLSKIEKRKEVIQAIQELELLELLSKTKVDRITYYKLTDSGHDFITEFDNKE